MALPNPAPPPKKSGFSPDIMNTLQKQNAPQSPMSTQDIIRTEFENNGSGMDWQQMYAEIVDLIKKPNYRILRSGNSLLLVRNNGNGDAYVFMASADKPAEMMAHMKEFWGALKKSNFKKVSFDTPRPAIVRLVKSTGVKVNDTMGKRPEPGTNKPSIHVEVEL